jgi:asparagine synthase (glutamine-hydrolysing)
MRYLAIIGSRASCDDPAGPASGLLRSGGFVPVVDSATHRLWCDDARQVSRLNGGDGVILGTLFRNGSTSAAPPDFSFGQSTAISQGRGDDLLQRYWGGYVAFLPEPRSTGVVVVRAPLGLLGCYHVRVAGGVIVTNDVPLLVTAGLAAGTVDWVGVAAHLVAPHVRPEATAIAGVTELTGGCRMTVRDDGTTLDEPWSPWSATGADRSAGANDTSRRLASVIDDTVAAWASRSRRILLALSGGLDSSIIAAALARAGADFACITLVSADASGDERRYARMVTDHLDRALHARDRSVDGVDVTVSHATHLPRPLGRAFSQESDRIQQGVAAEIGANAYFHGGGGDNVFGYQTSAAPLVDRLRMEGPGPGALRTAMDIGAMTDVGQWVVWRKAIARLASRRAAYRIVPDDGLVDRSIVAAAQARATHKWLVPPRRALPGKAAHVALVHFALNYLEGFARERTTPNIAPLMSQPVVECCLSIPSWLWFRQGWNRIVARDAYRDRLPTEIVDRRSKGAPDSFAVALFERNHDAIRAMLLDGVLARAHVIDRVRVERALTDNRIPRGHQFWSLMALADAEAWARAWCARAAGVRAP